MKILMCNFGTWLINSRAADMLARLGLLIRAKQVDNLLIKSCGCKATDINGAEAKSMHD